ncbi:MAG: hypothetical protein K6T75_05670 [Acetobacteraceae bacterium]|nr:hypothetical protein [Acetobacteraceae bacterium]
MIELMVVIAIIGLLVTIVVPRVTDALDQGRKTSAWASAKGLHAGLERYYFDNDEYPGTVGVDVTTYAAFRTLVQDYVDLPADSGDAPFIFVNYKHTDDDPEDYELEIESKDRSHQGILITPDGVRED